MLFHKCTFLSTQCSTFHRTGIPYTMPVLYLLEAVEDLMYRTHTPSHQSEWCISWTVLQLNGTGSTGFHFDSSCKVACLQNSCLAWPSGESKVISVEAWNVHGEIHNCFLFNTIFSPSLATLFFCTSKPSHKRQSVVESAWPLPVCSLSNAFFVVPVHLTKTILKIPLIISVCHRAAEKRKWTSVSNLRSSMLSQDKTVPFNGVFQWEYCVRSPCRLLWTQWCLEVMRSNVQLHIHSLLTLF